MIGITNVGGGGGMAYAYIGVVYDAGATVTCTDGNKTYRAKDTSGLYVFPVPYAATWIVTATDGTSTKSESVVIDSLWQDVVVDLGFWDGTVYYAGNQYADQTGGLESAANMNYTSGTVTITNHVAPVFQDDTIYLNLSSSSRICALKTVNKIDITEASSISISYTKSSQNTPLLYFALDSDGTGYINRDSEFNAQFGSGNTGGEFSADISEETGSLYVIVGGCSASGSGTAYISKIKLNYE